jgi:mono/diheme cytochrome c family protein
MHSRPSVHRVIAIAVSGVLAPFIAHSQPQSSESPEALQFFEKKIRPLLADRCYSCHSADTKAAGGLRVDDRSGIMLGGDAGPAVVPGDPDNSLILQRIRHANPKRKMPKEGEHLNDEEIADLVTWIKDGAAWPRERIPSSLTTIPSSYEQLKSTHWAWQAPTNPAPPKVADTSWPFAPSDNFILAKLEAEKLAPVPDANRETLIRRITYDLTGLPPSPEEIDAFVNDPSPRCTRAQR